MKIKKFYDTCALIADIDNLIENKFNFDLFISTITLNELEELKRKEKDLSNLQQIRKTIRALEQKVFNYEIWIFKNYFNIMAPIREKALVENNDTEILACAIECDKKYPDEVVFVTNDLALKTIANLFFGEDSIESISPNKIEYTGFLEITPTEEEMAALYTDLTFNHFNLIPGQYLILRGTDGQVLDRLCWTGQTHRMVKYEVFESVHFGKIKPYKDDPYQALLFDSLKTNTLTLVGGPAGSGKSFVALAYLFSQLEKHEIDRIVIFCNPVVAKDAAKLGFYPGTQEEKLLSSQVGNILASKLGSMDEVEKLISQEKLVLMPVGDARGYEVPQHSGVYVMEAQNLNINLIKLILQRIGEDCVCIIDGDRYTQTDLLTYEIENGMKRVSDVFKGYNFFGQVDLQNIYRSRLAKVAEKL